MSHNSLNGIVDKWIRDDEDVNARWEVLETEDNRVVVSGKLIITIDDRAYEVSGSSCTENDDDSIGRAIQAINDGILKYLKN